MSVDLADVFVQVDGLPLSAALSEKDYQIHVLKQKVSMLELELSQVSEMLNVVANSNVRKMYNTPFGNFFVGGSSADKGGESN